MKAENARSVLGAAIWIIREANDDGDLPDPYETPEQYKPYLSFMLGFDKRGRPLLIDDEEFRDNAYSRL